ncbi:MAG TPA: hypothetical protein VF339_05410 [Gammaproteobacteria bacterium]
MKIRVFAAPARRARAAFVLALAFAACGARGQQAEPPSPRDVAPIDLTGQWVSIVTEDWRFRMMTPPKGEYPGITLTPAGRAIADAWDPARDEAEGNACKAYGVAAIMRVPGRLRIEWVDDSTLEIRTDAGSQTRRLYFGDVPVTTERTWQGVSAARWILHGGGRGQPPANASLEVVTTGFRSGYLRKNGVPYSENASITEYFDLLRQPDGTEWLVVKTIVEDPEYLAEPYITSSNFRREEGRDGWNPTECVAD